MALHSGDYIRNLVGHVPSKMLSLRQDEVSVFSRMNVQGRRRVSLPSKLSGITEKDQSEGRDIQESLNKSYSEMKSKLDELEEYNQRLEKQLNDIFSSISATVSKADRNGLGKLKSREGGGAGEEKFSLHKGAAITELPGATELTYDRYHMESKMLDETHSNINHHLGVQSSRKLSQPGTLSKQIIREEEDWEETPNKEQGSSVVLQSSISKSNDNKVECKISNKSSQFTSEIGSYSTKKKSCNHLSPNSQLNEILAKLERTTSTKELKHLKEDELACDNTTDEESDDSDLYEIKKHTFLHLVEDKIKPIVVSKKDLYDEVNKIANKEEPIEASDVCFMTDKNCANKHKEYSRSKEYGRLNKTCGGEENNYRAHRNINELLKYDNTNNNWLYADCQKHTRRISAIDPPPFSTLSEIKEEERTRRLSTGTMHSISNLSLGERKKGNINKNNYLNKSSKHPSNLLTEIKSSSTIATSSYESIGVPEDLLVSPPEYLNFHEESDSVDEFFLFSEEVLNVNFETICEELARFSNDMEILLDISDCNSSYLKAAKASDEWKTLWIYRGM